MRLTSGINATPRSATARRALLSRAASALVAAVLGLVAPAAAQAPPAQPFGPAPAPGSDTQAPALQRYAILPPWANPRTIEFEEGDPILPGYTLRTRPHRALVTAGLVTFSSAYAVSLLVSGVASAGGENDNDGLSALLLPFGGPIVALSSSRDDGAGMFMLALDEVLQTGGLLLFAAGLANEVPYLQRLDVGLDGGASQLASLRPEVSLGPSSATLRWRF